MQQVLVLNVGFQPIAKVDWQKAIVQVLCDRVAEVVEEYPDQYIRTPKWEIKMPSVIRLLTPIPRKRGIKFSRHGIYLRDHGRCQYCGSHVSRDQFTYEHVVPRVQGGKTTWENVVVACVPCNQAKAGRTPAQAGMRLLSTPIKPKSLPHAPRQLCYREGMPESWANWLRSETYWNIELEKDE